MNSVEQFFKNMSYKKKLEQMCSDFIRIYGEEAEKWFLDVELLVKKSCEKWQITYLTLLPGASLGIIISGYSEIYNKRVVVKIVPFFINRFEQELMAYKMLSKKYMAKLLDYDIENKILVIELIEPATPFVYKKEKRELTDFFKCIFQNTEIYTGDGNNNIESYWKLYERIKMLAEKSHYLLDYREACNARTNYIKNKYFDNIDLYYMHGDLHSGNVIKKGAKFVAIDPLGFLAPKEFIFARFSIFELAFAKNKKEILAELVEFLKNYISIEKFYMALIVDTDLAILTGIVQLNDGYEMTNRFVEVMIFLEMIFKKYNNFE